MSACNARSAASSLSRITHHASRAPLVLQRFGFPRFDKSVSASNVPPVSGNEFPSGPWTGFYNYSPKDKHRMDLHLDFANGNMSGDGNDDIGRFVIKGKYDEPARECTFHKTYVGAHTVSYRGFREGKGIWGTWDIGVFEHGGFHIWPLGQEAGDQEAKAAEEPQPVEQSAKPAVPTPS